LALCATYLRNSLRLDTKRPSKISPAPGKDLVLSQLSQPTIRSILRQFVSSGANGTEGHLGSCGISYQFLQQFIAEFGVSEDEPSWQVCKRLIMVHTILRHECYYRMLQGGRDLETDRPWAGKPTVFVSHAWSTPFVNLSYTIKQFQVAHGSEHFYYIDLFGLNQHELAAAQCDSFAIASKLSDKLVRTLEASVMLTDHLLVALNSWDNPAPLLRIWCLYEIWCAAIKFDKPIVMGFPSFEAVRFATAVKEQMEMGVEHVVAMTVDIAKASATNASDVSLIRQQIQKTIDLDDFNHILRAKVTAHLVHCAIHTSTGAAKKPDII